MVVIASSQQITDTCAFRHKAQPFLTQNLDHSKDKLRKLS